MEVENQSGSIEQWFKRAITLDRNWRESRRKEERLRGKKESNGALAPKLNNQERQILPRPQVWQRRQKILLQQVTTEPTPMEGVERMNAVMARPQQQGAGFPQRNPYAMDVDRNNRNCYACGDFRHLARHCRNRGAGMNRRMETEDNNNNLNGDRGLMSPN